MLVAGPASMLYTFIFVNIQWIHFMVCGKRSKPGLANALTRTELVRARASDRAACIRMRVELHAPFDTGGRAGAASARALCLGLLCVHGLKRA
jgi:hypothetical protein